MALIKCPECSKEVSDEVSTCPHCGTPIVTATELEAVEEPPLEIQETSRDLNKNQRLIAASLFFCGIILLLKFSFTASESRLPGLALVSVLMTVSGIIFYVVTKIRIWWHQKRSPTG